MVHTPRYAQITATGRYVPERSVDNAEIERILGEPVDEWLVKNVGIRRRHFMAPGENTSDLAVPAARQALLRAGLQATDLDLILVAGDTPDYPSPATASVVQAKLGATRAGVADVNCACASWVTALDMAARYIATDSDFRHVLVVGAYGMSRYIDWKDKATCTLFADGAGAVIVSAGDQPGFLGSKLLGRGEHYDALGIFGGGTARPSTPENLAAFGPPRVQFVKKFPRTFNSDNWPPLIRAAADKAGVALDDIKLYLLTQLNLRTIEQVMGHLGQPMSKAHTIMDKWGYTGSACVPMALDDAVQGGWGGRLSPGDAVLFCASGGGLAMAASVWRWTA